MLADSNHILLSLPPWVTLVTALVPIVWLVGSLFPPRTVARAGALGGAALLLALAAGLGGRWVAPGAALLRQDVVAQGMLLLVSFLGWILMRYAVRYLEGDAGRRRFLRWLAATLASISTLVVADHLVLLGVAWIAASLCLHQLLVFYPERPLAVLAAHQKFVLSRVAEVCLVGAFALLVWSFETLSLGGILEAAGSEPLPALAGWAMVLLSAAAILKCAQLPFHGWLIQVMETPTPVSALLHAGIINLGGFLLLSFAPLLAGAEVARWALVVVGGSTAALAGLITMTRVSVKVGLAWSTCAQMGFMLLEIGLGLYELAFLHLVAHSLYKAHAFLSSGRTVRLSEQRRWAQLPQAHTPLRWVAATLGGLVLAFALGALIGAFEAVRPAFLAALWIFGLGLATLLGEALARRQAALLGRVGLSLGLLLGLYALWHALFAASLAGVARVEGSWASALVAGALLTVPFIAYVALRMAPAWPGWRPVYGLLYHGLYLDEIFSRLVFQIWPPRGASGREARGAANLSEPQTVNLS